MPSRQDKCRTCNSRSKVIGSYCADCTTNFIRKRVGWDKVKWWGGQYSGDDRAHTRVDKQELFNSVITGYCVAGFEVEEGLPMLREQIKVVVSQSPPYRGSDEALEEKIDEIVKILRRRISFQIAVKESQNNDQR